MTDLKKVMGLDKMLTEEELEKVAGGQIVCHCAYTDETQKFIRVNILNQVYETVQVGHTSILMGHADDVVPGYTIAAAEGGNEMERLKKMYPGITFEVVPFKELS